LRVSKDRSGKERSQDDQHADNAHAAGEHGWEVGAWYREAGSSSASKFATKRRDAFERLISDLEEDRFKADVLIIWESSRGSRRVQDWVTLIDLCVRRKVTIFVTTHGREYDPANGRDRRSLLEDAVDSEYEASKTSVRIKRAAAANARDGKPHGAVPFGYVRKFDERTRKFISQDPHPVQAAIVREIFARFRQGHSMRKIGRDLAGRDVRVNSGRLISHVHVRNILINPAYAGIRTHQPSDGPRRVGRPFDATTPHTDAIWKKLVPRRDFLAVQRLLSDPERSTHPTATVTATDDPQADPGTGPDDSGPDDSLREERGKARPGKARHLLSMIIHCDVCGSELSVTNRYGYGEYICHARGHVRVREDELDRFAEAAIIAYLSREDVYADLTAAEHDGDREDLARMQDELAEVSHELASLQQAAARRSVSIASFELIEPALLAQIATLEAAVKDLTTPADLRALIVPGPDVAERWQAAELSTRRAVVRKLFTPDRLGDLRITHARTRTRSPRPPVSDRVTLYASTGPNTDEHAQPDTIRPGEGRGEQEEYRRSA
jgi:DNA invertase Pin-like site-specific DNA recombinase